jgi:hypothetical protein
MFLSPWNLAQAILFALGVWWCVHMTSRLRDDVGKFREPDDQADRPVIIILWIITGLILLVCVRFGLNIGESISHGIRDLW